MSQQNDPIEEALASIGLFQVPQPPLREFFADWLVDALHQASYVRPRTSYTSAAYQREVREHIPDWAHGLPPEETT